MNWAILTESSNIAGDIAPILASCGSASSNMLGPSAQSDMGDRALVDRFERVPFDEWYFRKHIREGLRSASEEERVTDNGRVPVPSWHRAGLPKDSRD